MTKSDKNLLAWAAIVVGSCLAISWLESSPNCDRGCKTQLEHLKSHILKDALAATVPQLRPFFG